MKLSINELRSIVQNVLIQEIGIDKIKNLKRTSGSTHDMNTAKIIDDERQFFIKFSHMEDDVWNEGDPDPSMQCMSEYLAYKIYALYPHVKIPSRVELVFDPKNKRVGLATSAIKGKMALGKVSPQALAKKLEAGVYVDIFLANYDVVGTGTGNLMTNTDDDSIVRIDPGSAFKYRARGGRKGSQFNANASELNTMLDPKFNYGQAAGGVFQYANLKTAAKEFLAINWSTISSTIDEIHSSVSSELQENNMNELNYQWNDEINDIKSILSGRYKVVVAHAKKILAI